MVQATTEAADAPIGHPVSKTDAPFWSDDFDMDLPKIFSGAREILGDLADVQMWTGGRPDANGRLNLPACWNMDNGLTAFFGLRNTGRDENYFYCQDRVRCTAWEAFRDCWAHHFIMVVERRLIWDGSKLWSPFETIMWNIRGWGDGSKASDDEGARQRAWRSYRAAVGAFRVLVKHHAAKEAL